MDKFVIQDKENKTQMYNEINPLVNDSKEKITQWPILWSLKIFSLVMILNHITTT